MNPDRQHELSNLASRGWHSRGYLPHYDGGDELTQSVTFRLADSVPSHLVEAWQEELLTQPEAERELELHRLVEKYLDVGHGACHLRDPQIGSLVETALLFFDAKRYRLHAWVVMPNHVHVLFTPIIGRSLSDIVGSWKSFTAKEANKLLHRSGQFWQKEYFDRFIRTAEHFGYALDYIEKNPLKAGLCLAPEDWPFGSARYRAEVVGTATFRTDAEDE
ncbi:MAG: transposase [Planctomycetia bacterium]|nr:transposase [Planctomycetia bacterium]